MCSDPLDPGGEVRGCSVGCTLGMLDVLPLGAAAALDVHTYGVSRTKKIHFQGCVFWVRRDFAISDNFTVVGREKSTFSGVLIGPKSLFCFTPLNAILKMMPHTAASCCKKQQQQASRAAAHVESSDTMHSRKAQCQAPPYNPETADAYHSRERSYGGEKIEHENVYKQHSSSAPPTTTTSPPTRQQHNYWVELVRICRLDVVLLPQRVALIVTTRTHPRQTRHGLSEGSGVAQFPPSPAGRQAGWYRYLLAALFLLIGSAVRGRFPQPGIHEPQTTCILPGVLLFM